MANFGLTATSLVEIWTQAWSSASTSNFHKGMFSFLDRMIPFLSSWGLLFFSQRLSSTFEFCKVRDVNKIWK